MKEIVDRLPSYELYLNELNHETTGEAVRNAIIVPPEMTTTESIITSRGALLVYTDRMSKHIDRGENHPVAVLSLVSTVALLP